MVKEGLLDFSSLILTSLSPNPLVFPLDSSWQKTQDEIGFTFAFVEELGVGEEGLSAQLAALGPTVAPQHEYYYKPLEAGGKRTAVLLMNNGFNAADLRLAFKDIPGVKCTRCHVRDIWERRDLGNFDGSYLAKGVAPHAAAALMAA